MAINFPTSPTVGDTYTVNSVVYTWDGTKWNASTGFVSYTYADKIQEGDSSAEIVDNGGDAYFVVTNNAVEKFRVNVDGQLGTPYAGNASSPALYMGGDINSGLYSAGADQVAVATSGAQRINIEADGDINIDSGGVFYDATNNRLAVGKTSPNSTFEIYHATEPYIYLQNSTSGTGANDGFNIVLSGSDAYINNRENGSMLFYNNGSERLRITSDGKVGLGTSSPNLYDGNSNNLVIATTGNNAGMTIATSSTGSAAINWADGTTGDERYRGSISYSHFHDRFIISTATTAAVAIDSSQRVGIGTTSPAAKLDVVVDSNRNLLVQGKSGTSYGLEIKNGSSNSAGSLLLSAASSGSIAFYRDTAESARIDSSGRVGIGTSTITEKLTLICNNDTSAVDNGLGIYRSAGDDKITINAQGGAARFVADGGSSYMPYRITQYDGTTLREAVHISSTGNVGIGTTSPGSLLSLQASSAAADFNIRHTASGNGYGWKIATTGTTTNDLIVSSEFNSSFTERARIDSSGRLLVGTSSATSAGSTNFAKFYVKGDKTSENNAAFQVLWKGSTPSSGDLLGRLAFVGGTTGAPGAYIDAYADGEWFTGGDTTDQPTRLVFSTTADAASSPTEWMRITNNGEVFINRTSTDAEVTSSCKLQVQGTASQWTAHFRNTNAAPYGVRIKYNTDANSIGNEFLVCSGSTIDRLVLRSNGGLANYSANNANLSDRNAKKDISLAADTWDCIKEWEIVNYRYKDQPDDADLNLGVIAQQVAESCPEVITVFQEAKEATEDQPAQEERLGVKEQQMYWMAIKALQEAQVRIEQLEARLTAAGIE